MRKKIFIQARASPQNDKKGKIRDSLLPYVVTILRNYEFAHL